MDSPLNRAHQQERKAEKLILSKKYMEAVTCYEIAAGYITEAMKVTTASEALVSMQLQYQDHLRQQRILKDKIQRLSKAQKNIQDHNGLKDSSGKQFGDEKDDRNMLKQKSLEVIDPEKSDLSLTSLNSSQGVLVQEEDAVCSTDEERNVENISVQDLKMQVLSLTQALEDSNRENNHLRNIVVKFKEVLHRKFGLSEEQIEELLIRDDLEFYEHRSTPSEEDRQSETQDLSTRNTSKMLDSDGEYKSL